MQGLLLVLAGVALAMVAVAAYRLWAKNVRERSLRLEQQVAERTLDLAALYVENAQLYDDSRQRVAQLTALQEITRAVVSTLDLDSLLSLIVTHAANLLGAEGGLLNLVDWDREDDQVVAAAGSMAFAVGERSSLHDSLSGWVTLHNEPVISNRIWEDQRVARAAKAWIEAKGLRHAALAPLTVKNRVIGTLAIVNKRNSQTGFDPSDVDALQLFADQAATAIQNAQLFAAEQRRTEQFRVISEVGSQITSIMPVEEILEHAARLIQDAFGYYHVGVGLIEGDEVVYRVGAGQLWDAPRFSFKPQRLKVGQHGLTGWVAASGAPALVMDVRDEPRYVPMQDSQTLSELIVPITVKGQVIGVLDVQSDRLNGFDETDLKVLQTLAHQTGAAIENTQLYEAAHQAAVLEERGRLARDLHDAVTQTLFSASLLAEVLPATWEIDQEQGRLLLKELRQLSRGALAEMRTLLLELRPAVLAEADLGDLLRQLVDACTGRTGMPVSLTVSGDCDPPEDVHLALYRIAQEALNNIVKHARAQHVTVSLQCRPASGSDGADHPPALIELTIADDGVGFDPSQIPPDHLGLGIIRERAQVIGADLAVASQPGQGTTVRVAWLDRRPENTGSRGRLWMPQISSA
jgi:nitrate/nitrite-specific signal transduction histidine kinase